MIIPTNTNLLPPGSNSLVTHFIPGATLDDFSQLFNVTSRQPENYLATFWEAQRAEEALSCNQNQPTPADSWAGQVHQHQSDIDDLVAENLTLEEAAGKIFRYIAQELKNYPLSFWGHLIFCWEGARQGAARLRNCLFACSC